MIYQRAPFIYLFCSFVIVLSVNLIIEGNSFANDFKGLTFPITDITKTYIRKGPGEWGAPRATGTHGGVDIIVNASYSDTSAYVVSPIAPGVIAYSRLNGSETSGYGNLIVIDHGNDVYTLYGHLANSPFTPIKLGGNLLKHIGDAVSLKDILGYFVDIKADVDSTGNARRTHPEAKHQIHFEVIRAPSGRRGSSTLKESILKHDGVRVDPTPMLLDLGYKVR